MNFVDGMGKLLLVDRFNRCCGHPRLAIGSYGTESAGERLGTVGASRSSEVVEGRTGLDACANGEYDSDISGGWRVCSVQFL